MEIGSDGEDDEGLLAVEHIVKDFHDLDKSGAALRYAATKQGMLMKLPSSDIDLQNLQEVMEAVDNFFTGVDGQLDANSSAADH